MSDRFVDALRAYDRRIQRKHQETWKKHARTFPQLRIWLSNLTRPVRKYVQHARSAVRATREYGALVAARSGVPRRAQLLQQLKLYNKHHVPADCYYFLGMYEAEVRRKARFFLTDKLTGRVLHHLATTAPDEEHQPLHDKVAFWKHCQRHGLSAVPVLAVFNDGGLRQDYSGIGGALPPRDLFSKPVSAFLGRGARKWTYDDAGRFSDDKGHTYAPSAVIDALKEQSRGGKLILQPCVYDHPRLRERTGQAGPSTLRIITLRRPDASPEYFAGFLTTPLEAVSAPTFKKGTALAARVEPASGQLGRLRGKRVAYLLEGRERHPKTERRMAGFALPHWEEAKSLALRAHATLPNIACVGWDVVLTNDGPLLLEGNNDCSAALTQIMHQRLLGQTRFPAYLHAHMQKRPRVEA